MSLRARIISGAVVATTAALLSPTAVGANPTASGADSVRVTGTVLVLPGEGGEPDQYSLRLGSGRIIELADGFAAEPLSHFTGSLAVPGTTGGLALTGLRRTSTLRRVSAAGTAMKVVSSRLAPGAPSPGPASHTTYVAKVTNFGPIALTDSQILAAVNASQAYWVRESGGQIPSWGTTATVAAVASGVGSSATGCGLGNGGADFNAIADNVGAQAYPGVDFSGASPNHLVIVVPRDCGAGTTGRGRLGTSFANGGPLIFQALAEPQPTIDHEYGHNLGLQHSNNNAAEYGGLYEVMGSGPDEKRSPVLGTVYRWEQGIIAAGEVVDGTAGGSWNLASRAAASGLRGVVFIDPDTGRRHFVDYRNGAGNDANTCYATVDYCNYATAFGQNYRPGIVVERENDKSGSHLLPAAGNDGALQGGEVWSNTSGSLKVTGNSNNVTVTRVAVANTVAGGSASMSAPVALRDVTAAGSGFAPTPAGYRYQWYINGAAIPGAEEAIFRPTAAMAGGALSVVVTAYAIGHNPVARVSAPQTVKPAEWYANGTRRYPEITGATRVGGTLTALGLDWVNFYDQKPADFTTVYQWSRNGNPIKGATASTYRLTSKDLGKRIQVAEYPRAAGYLTSDFARSDSTAKISLGRLATARPKIKGKAKVGRTVKAATPGWTTGTKFRYQWFVGKVAIKGATKKKFHITRSMRGKKLVVKVTGKKTGYRKATVKSRATKVR